jgi:ribonuclease Y
VYNVLSRGVDNIEYIWSLAVGLLVGLFAGYIVRRYIGEHKIKGAEQRAKEIIDVSAKEAEQKRKEAELEAKDLLYRTKAEFEKETKERRHELLNLEKRLIQREENLDQKVDILEKKEREVQNREKGIAEREKGISAKEKEFNALLAEEKERLQRISGMNAEEAKKLLLVRMEQEVRKEASIMTKRIEDQAKEGADKKAREIVSLAIQRCAADHVVESTVSVVNLPSDEMKGRIIGREGRNIRALETATGVDVIIDDTPEAVILSGFDVMRREIARITLERLIADGRIHPARIEEMVDKVKKELETSIREEGERAAFDVGVHGLHPETIRLLGKLKYRTSYGQNVLVHSKEVAYLMGVIAGELGGDVPLAKRVGLLHDIGKAVDHDVEGTHARIGAELLRKYGESEAVIHSVEAHHREVDQQSLYAVLAEAADAISASRPGARRETLEAYVKRLQKLESIADSFKGVEKAYAIQAGREVRVIVQPDRISDLEAFALARDITKKIEEGLEYPGQVKVTVIRETRAVEYAK